MIESIWTGNRSEEIGVHSSASGGQRLFKQSRPGSRIRIIDVINFIAAAAETVPVMKDHPSVRRGKKTGVGALLLAVPDQRGNTDEGCRIVRSLHPEIDQGDRMHVCRNMKTAGAVAEHLNGIVRIPADRCIQSMIIPPAGVKKAGRNHQLPIRPIVADILSDLCRQKTVIHLVTGPCRTDGQLFDQFRRFCFQHVHTKPLFANTVMRVGQRSLPFGTFCFTPYEKFPAICSPPGRIHPVPAQGDPP